MIEKIDLKILKGKRNDNRFKLQIWKVYNINGNNGKINIISWCYVQKRKFMNTL